MKTIIEMAREAGLERGGYWEFDLIRLKRFADLVRADERERPWVRLTEVDMLDASRHWRHAEDFMAGVYWAAGTLKEKNT
jgi:hypothetical protein